MRGWYRPQFQASGPDLRHAAALAHPGGVRGRALKAVSRVHRRTRKSWYRNRRTIAKPKALPENGDDASSNSSFIAALLQYEIHPGRTLGEKFCCAQWNAENRVKGPKPGPFAERCSSNLFDANALRLRLFAFAHVMDNRVNAALTAAGRALAPAWTNEVVPNRGSPAEGGVQTRPEARSFRPRTPRSRSRRG